MEKWNLLSPSDCGRLFLFSLEVPPSEMFLYLKKLRNKLEIGFTHSWRHFSERNGRKWRWGKTAPVSQGNLHTVKINPLPWSLLYAHSHRFPCRCTHNTGRSTHRAHTRNPASWLTSQGREKQPSCTAEQEARHFISTIKLANTGFVHEPVEWTSL